MRCFTHSVTQARPTPPPLLVPSLPRSGQNAEYFIKGVQSCEVMPLCLNCCLLFGLLLLFVFLTCLSVWYHRSLPFTIPKNQRAAYVHQSQILIINKSASLYSRRVKVTFYFCLSVSNQALGMVRRTNKNLTKPGACFCGVLEAAGVCN